MSQNRILSAPQRAVRSAGFVALLSFILPGLGQAVLGRYRRAVVFAVPAIALFAAAIRLGRTGLTSGVFDPSFMNGLIAIDLITILYQIAAVVDAYAIAARRPRTAAARSIRYGASPRSATPARGPRIGAALAMGMVVVLVFATVGVHGYIAVNYLAPARDAVEHAFTTNQPGWISLATPTAPNGSAPNGPTPTPAISLPPSYPIGELPASIDRGTSWTTDGKLSLLLIGVDQGCGGDREVGLRTDSMILLEVDQTTNRAALYGIPRNLTNVPLPQESAVYYPSHSYPSMLNSLWQAAQDNPGAFPYYQDNGFMRGITALEGAVGTLTGVHVDGTVLVNLMGFVYIVDAIHGIDLNLTEPFVDHPDLTRTFAGQPDPYNGYPSPDCNGHITYDWPVGPRHLNGFDALAYARARGQTDDYTRMGRQQEVLKAIRDKVNPCSLLGDFNAIVTALGQSFWTDVPLKDAPDLIRLASRVSTSKIQSYTFTPANIGTANEVLTQQGWANVKHMVAHGLDEPIASPAPTDSSSGTPTPGGSGGGGGGGGGGFC